MTVQEWQAGLTEQAGQVLAHWVKTTTPEKLDWRPSAAESSNARSVMEVAHECIQVNRALAGVLRGVTPDPENAGGPPPTGVDQVAEALINSAEDVADAIRALDDDAFERTYQTSRGPLPGARLITIPANHMQYHGGQVNYIQVLYGDTEFRVPGRG